jgi:predicted SAM-dependent methyltransferase
MTMPVEFDIVKQYCTEGIGLNIGCGNARVGNSIGVDIDSSKRSTVIVAPAWALPIADNSIDYIVSTACIEHLDRSPVEVLKEWNRVLKTGGMCAVTTPEGSVTKSEWALRVGSNDLYPHLLLFTLKQLELYFKVSKFEIIRSEEIDRMPSSPEPTILVVGRKI